MNTKTALTTLAFLLSYSANAQVMISIASDMTSVLFICAVLAFVVLAFWAIAHGLRTKRKLEGGFSDEPDTLLDHDYDGIQELDNNLPPWWLYGFYLSIFFAATYLVDYHVLKTSPLPAEEYETEMAIANEMKAAQEALIDESTLVKQEDADALEKGKIIYNTNCLACHQADGGGLVGPNLTDAYWVHGGSFNDIYSTIKNGVPEKGMISWEAMLSPTQIQQVTSYIMSLPAVDGKAAEGDLYQETE